MESTNITRREMLKGGAAIAAAAVLPAAALAQAPAMVPDTRTGKDWPARRAEIERGWLSLLGDFPKEIPDLKPIVRKVTFASGCPSERLSDLQKLELKAQMAEERGSIERYHVSYQAEDKHGVEANDRVTAWLLVPVAARENPLPAVVCIHSTTRGAGKDQVIGISGRTRDEPPDTSEGGRSYGLHLARYGYVTLSLDLLADGERVEPGVKLMETRPFYSRHPEWSIVGKNIWDIQRGVDFLQTLDFVDGRYIGVTGLSLGGHMSVFAAAFEPRIGATLSVGGVYDWHRPTETWSRSKGAYIYIKKFRPYVDDPTLPVPADFDGLMMLVAPRPQLILCSEWEFHNRRNLLGKCLAVAKVYRDWVDTDGLPSVLAARKQRRSYAKTLSYYKERYDISPEKMETELTSIGAGDCFGWFSFPGGHSFPPLARQYSLAWLDRWFDRDQRWYGRYARP